MVTRLHERWRAVPLSARLVAIIAALLLVGLATISGATLAVLRVTLLGQVDEDLTTSAQDLGQRTLDQLQGGRSGQNLLPSDYYVLIAVEGSAPVPVVNPRTAEQYGSPELADVDLAAAAAGREPFTVAGEHAGTSWRAITLTVSGGADGPAVGAVTVARPLAPAQATLAQTARLLTLAGLLIAAVGALAARLAVRRSLRPLREIEATAGAIAAGDLSRRVPTPPPTTEVGSLARSLNVMLAQIESSFAARAASEQRMRQFVSDASHELRTPLATVRGYGELYRMGGVADVDQAMNRIETEAKRMGNLVEDLLQLARLDEGRPLDLRPVDLAAVAADAVADLAALAPDRPAAVVPLTGGATAGGALPNDEAPGGASPAGGAPGTGGLLAPVPVTADPDRVRQVVANLVGNVLQHTPAGTPVEVAVGMPEPGWALLEVRDHGPGIPPAEAARVFERFYRVDPSRTRSSGGSGLGLAIVAAVVGAHGGAVRVLPTPGGGTTVQVALPTGAEAPGGQAGAGAAGAADTVAPGGRSGAEAAGTPVPGGRPGAVARGARPDRGSGHGSDEHGGADPAAGGPAERPSSGSGHEAYPGGSAGRRPDGDGRASDGSPGPGPVPDER
ncbi:ATP-binding protein [Georgenia sp. TF02-10]|uniref:ATP-binding protein n=1 Tax=Georgenia sp. TF02-10 TaxID=2917725 RepID=UPI001FA72825|nr:ATP-binding protein [Georgenia sp. TF02-10]UNX55314.1 ATP-binding protein [Georgenia sp. TF02-10]